MVSCPICKHQELPGALFCSECGEQLAPGAGDRMDLESEIVLYLVDTGQLLPFGGKKEATLGRSGDGPQERPEIDLSPYKAYEAGVSRRHASICLGEHGLVVVDLGSANGTQVNGRKLESHVPHPVDPGDVLLLGKLKIEIMIRRG